MRSQGFRWPSPLSSWRLAKKFLPNSVQRLFVSTTEHSLSTTFYSEAPRFQLQSGDPKFFWTSRGLFTKSPGYYVKLDHDHFLSHLLHIIINFSIDTVVKQVKVVTKISGNAQSVHYRAYNNPKPVPILRSMNPIHTFPSCFQKIHLNFMPQVLRPYRFPNQNLVCLFIYIGDE